MIVRIMAVIMATEFRDFWIVGLHAYYTARIFVALYWVVVSSVGSR